MDADVFRVRVAPLLGPDALRALRLLNRAWQWIVDQLVPVKGALGLRRKKNLTPADARYAHAHMTIDQYDVLGVCAGGELEDLQWALGALRIRIFPAPDERGFEILSRVARPECMELLIRDFGVDTGSAFFHSCWGGHLAVAQWLVDTFQLTADDARVGNNSLFRWSCRQGQLAMAQWLVATFDITGDDVRAALYWGCSYRVRPSPAIARWLASTFEGYG
jgi:hypothetical protein